MPPLWLGKSAIIIIVMIVNDDFLYVIKSDCCISLHCHRSVAINSALIFHSKNFKMGPRGCLFILLVYVLEELREMCFFNDHIDPQRNMYISNYRSKAVKNNFHLIHL